MRLSYFDYDGKRYTSGTIIKIKPTRNKRYTLCDEAVFLYYIPEKNWYSIAFGPEDELILSGRDFFNILIGVTKLENTKYTEQICNSIKTENKTATFTQELQIDGMLVAWIWYIFLMILVTFFNDRILGYVGFSIIFFRYRNKKLREAGYL